MNQLFIEITYQITTLYLWFLELQYSSMIVWPQIRKNMSDLDFRPDT